MAARYLPRLALLAAATALPTLARAEPPTRQVEEMTDHVEAARETHRRSGRQLLVVPIPQSSPTLGSGITLVGALFYNPSQEPEPWISGAGLMRTSNGSWGAGAMHKMSLGHDRFRAVAFAGYADINIEFFGIGPNAGSRGRSIELNEEGVAALVQGQMRVADNLYAGARVQFLDLSTSINRENPLFPDAEIPRREFDSRLVSIGPVVSYDTRDSSMNPSRGLFVQASWLFGAEWLGSDFDHDKFTINGNLYYPLTPSTVFAGRAALCGTSGLAPFYDLCLYGAQGDLRGYETGRYRDRASWAIQYEVRQHLFGRFGAVAFAGVGGTAPRLSDLGDSTVLPSAGFGLRYMVSRQNRVNLRVDFAVGRDSHALYVSVGEAF